VRTLVLHPYYKLAYIKLAWGGKKEQEEEIAAGNPHAKNWQDEARKLVESGVSSIFYNYCYRVYSRVSDGKILEDSTSGTTSFANRHNKRGRWISIGIV
jgi:hypothetical protein